MKNETAQGGNAASKSSRIYQQWDSACEYTKDDSLINTVERSSLLILIYLKTVF